MTRPQKVWHREDIKAEIRKKGATLRSISTDAKLCKEAASHALTKPFPAAQLAVANFLGEDLHTLWPNWYDERGQRINARSTRKASPKRDGCHRKKSTPELAAGNGSKQSPHHPDSASARQARGDGVAVVSYSTAATPEICREA